MTKPDFKGVPLKPFADMAPCEKACFAIAARINGVWDNRALVAFGPLSTNTVSDIAEILEFYGVG